MAQKIDQLSVQFSADFASLLQEMKRAEAGSAKFRANVTREMGAANKTFDKFAAQAKTALIAVVGTFGTARIIGMARETLRWADDTKTLADRLGTSAESMQELIFAGRELNLTSAEMTKGMDRFVQKLAEASTGKGEGLHAFQALGIDIRNTHGQLKGLDTLLDEFADKIQKFDRPSQITLAKSFFGDEGAIKFLDLLGRGADHIGRLRQAARDAGAVVSNELVAKGEKLNKDIEKLTDTINADLRKAFLDLGPVIEGSLKVALSFLRETREFVNWLKGQGPGLTGKGALQPLSPEGRRRQMLRSGAVFIDENLEGQPLHDEAATSRTDAARMGPGGIPGVLRFRPPTSGAGSESELARVLRRVAEEAAIARAALEQGPRGQAWAKVADDLARLKANTEQSTQAATDFAAAWRDRGLAALRDVRAENEDAQRLLQAEIAGRKDLLHQIQIEAQLRRQFGAEFVEQNRAEIEGLARTRAALDEMQERARATRRVFEDMGASFRSGLGDTLSALVAGNRDAGEQIKAIWANVFADMSRRLFDFAMDELWRSIAGNLRGIGGAAGNDSMEGGKSGLGGFLGTAFGFIGGLLGFAEGGRPPVGVPSVVGERGPELFVPDVAGTIVPNKALGTREVNLYFNLQGANGSTEIKQAVMEGILRASPHIVDASMNRVRDRAWRDPGFFPNR